MKLEVAGTHNALNALAAVLAAHHAGVPWKDGLKGVGEFKGVDRRFQLRGEEKGVLFYDDYGHHPTEVNAVLQAFEEKFSDKNIYVLFQPHRYSRTELCWGEFLNAFDKTERTFVLDIYAAGEAPLPGINGERLAQEIKNNKGQYVGQFANAAKVLKNILKSGDVLVSLGAGDVNKFYDYFKQNIG